MSDVFRKAVQAHTLNPDHYRYNEINKKVNKTLYCSKRQSHNDKAHCISLTMPFRNSNYEYVYGMMMYFSLANSLEGKA